MIELSLGGFNRMAEFALEVRDSVMIAHSLPDEAFGRAQGMHGATFIVDVTLFRKELNEYNMVVNSSLAHEAVKAVLAPLNYANLDNMPEMKGQLTTTEFLARYIFNQLADVIADGMLGADGKALARIRVRLQESHISSVAYEGELPV
jgi:6-pyruvoyl-tetrahydropterin synthase